jgi:hypothetical protein
MFMTRKTRLATARKPRRLSRAELAAAEAKVKARSEFMAKQAALDKLTAEAQEFRENAQAQMEVLSDQIEESQRRLEREAIALKSAIRVAAQSLFCSSCGVCLKPEEIDDGECGRCIEKALPLFVDL